MNELELPDALRDQMRASWHRYLDLVTPIRPDLHRYCRRLTRNVWDAEDLAQEALLRAFGSLARHHDPVRNPRAYLLRIATHTWIDQLRRREREVAAQVDLATATPAPAPQGGAVRDAGRALLQRLSPQERAALVLKEVFDLSLEETAEVLETTLGAVKAALHRGRSRLREPEGGAASHRPLPSRAVLDRFVELFNSEDRAGLLDLVLDNATVENVGVGIQWGEDGHRSEKSWFEGALGGHPDWPDAWRYEAQRAECFDYEGEPVVLLFRTRRGREAMEGVLRFEERDGYVTEMRCYSFSPEVIRTVGEALGVEVRTGPYRYPTVEPGRSFGDPPLRRFEVEPEA